MNRFEIDLMLVKGWRDGKVPVRVKVDLNGRVVLDSEATVAEVDSIGFRLRLPGKDNEFAMDFETVEDFRASPDGFFCRRVDGGVITFVPLKR